jgi:hypothetical protein
MCRHSKKKRESVRTGNKEEIQATIVREERRVLSMKAAWLQRSSQSRK